MEKKRYVAAVYFYILAENEHDAKIELNEICELLDKKYDNRCKASGLYENNFGSLNFNPQNLLKET